MPGPRSVAMSGLRSSSDRGSAVLGSKLVAPMALSRPAKRAFSRKFMKQVVNASGEPMNIVFVSAEVSPWSKTGGLGDVVGSLPIELAKRGHKVMSIAPRYDQYRGAWDTSTTSNILGEEVRYFHEIKDGVDRVFVDNALFLAKVWGKTGSKLYGKKSGADFNDNQKRFAMLAAAAFECQTALPFGYGEDVVFVANDWHSALVPVLLKTKYQANGQFMNAKAALCVHNIAFQGRFWAKDGVLAELGVPEAAHEAFQFTDGCPTVYSEETPAEEEKPVKSTKTFEKNNWLKAGILYADKNLTVSPNYAEEMASGADKGVELDEVINSVGGFEGIVNGMDPTEWNPSKDKFLDVPYDEETVIEGKAAAKAALQAEVGLPIDPTVPLFGYIGRLEEQKGVDIMLEAIKEISVDAQVVVLGTGKKKFETSIKALEEISPNAVGVAKFSSPLAHMINAGADFLLVPSRFEPCGLIQLHAMQYGTVPVVASTGGLVDTVVEGLTGFQVGAMDPDDLCPEDVDALVETCKRACEIFPTDKYVTMVKNCIGQDLSWKEPAKKWEGVLEEMMHPSEAATSKKGQVVTPKESVISSKGEP
ncbi:hypothetical protein CYMTET_8165 [Cymbomonas tetramitiformis]|uniref:Starch synthase, chloroplastic/amyloplastic n=1 Tax=Cymbomonas tetramitiformis TaxID=36881 RepID=A0AAE0GTK3_9CHLO|nr:hypothetical protein CYMTET_8165 [Cymbomonas tetramitiformis]